MGNFSYLSLKPIWNEAYFIGKWSLFQWRMKLLLKANETTFNSQWSYFQQLMKLASISKEAFLLYYISKIVRDAWWINPLFEASVTHVISLEINILSAYFWKIVMGDRWFAKNMHVCSCIPNKLAASSLSSISSSLLRSLHSASSLYKVMSFVKEKLKTKSF